MTDIIIKIMVEVLNIFAIATKEMRQGRASALLSTRLIVANLCSGKFLKKLVGMKEMEGALKRLDKLTQEEARMAAAETLMLTHIIDNKVATVVNGKCGVLTVLLILNVHMSIRRSTVGKQRGQCEMFVAISVISGFGVSYVL